MDLKLKKEEYRQYKEKYLPSFGFVNQQITKVSLELILFLSMIAIFALFALKPTIITIVSLQKEIKLKNEIDQKLAKKVSALSQAQLVLAKVQNSLVYLDKTLPQEVEFTRFEREIEYLAVKNNVILADARFGQFDILGDNLGQELKKTSKTAYTPLSFTVIAGGSYQDLKNFLKDLEILDRLVIIDEIKFDKQAQVTGADLQAKITGKVYYLPYSK